jgi:dual specificity phosphatase 12
LDAPDGDDDGESKFPKFPGVSAVAIGCGIETQDDVVMIQNLVTSLVGQNIDAQKSILVQCVTSNPEYASMKQENEAFKALDAEQKEEATRLKVIGPGKMVKFASGLAKTLVELACSSSKDLQPHLDADHDEHDANTTMPLRTQVASSVPKEQEEIHIVDPNKVRYACRKCRMILFGQDDVEDHVPSRHSFARRNAHASTRCESFFLLNGLDWMGDISAVEGKFNCPKCHTRVGIWKWSGSQCSCGTWITPAIQIPLSKVDKVAPYTDGPPPGTIASPTLLLS